MQWINQWLTFVGIKMAKACCDRLLLAYSANFIVPTFVIVSGRIFLAGQLCACCARGKLPLSVRRLVTPLFQYSSASWNDI